MKTLDTMKKIHKKAMLTAIESIQKGKDQDMYIHGPLGPAGVYIASFAIEALNCARDYQYEKQAESFKSNVH